MFDLKFTHDRKLFQKHDSIDLASTRCVESKALHIFSNLNFDFKKLSKLLIRYLVGIR